MDPLSNLLALLKPRSVQTGRFDMGSKQGVRFPNYEGIKCYAVLKGHCWLALEGDEPLHLEEGDCFLLPRGRTFCLLTDRRAPPIDVKVLLAALYKGLPGVSQGECTCTLAGGQFVFAGNPTNLLLTSLPEIVHLHSESEKAAMRWSMNQMREELRHERLGSGFFVEQLGYMMLAQALRVHLMHASQEAVGWLYAIADPQIKTAIVNMQEKPGHPWTVRELAQQTGMSRSVFAEKFKERVGESPIEYLARWRMLLASDRLTNSDDSVLAVAMSLGYESESAFGKAFKRVMGCSPRQYSRKKQLNNSPAVANSWAQNTTEAASIASYVPVG